MPITRRMLLIAGSASALLASINAAHADETIRIATLASGTVAWELDTILHHRLDRKYGFNLSVIPAAGKQSADVMIAAGAADVIVTDWIWVSRQRYQGADYTFIPYSKQVGSVVVKSESPLKRLSDLKGKKIGVAGGPTDKSWILMQAFAKKTLAFDLAKEVDPVFAAPPLLNEELERGGIDALITYWQFAAPLKAKGARDIITLADAAQALGLDPEIPLLGYVFSEGWANAHPGITAKLAKASRDAKLILASDNAEWDRLRPLMNARTDQDFEALKAGFREGIPQTNEFKLEAAQRLYTVLSEMDGYDLTGAQTTLATGTFARF